MAEGGELRPLCHLRGQRGTGIDLRKSVSKVIEAGAEVVEIVADDDSTSGWPVFTSLGVPAAVKGSLEAGHLHRRNEVQERSSISSSIQLARFGHLAVVG